MIEKIFDDEGNENESPRENVDLRSDPKGKGLMYPSESFKNLMPDNESNQNLMPDNESNQEHVE